MPVFTDYSLFGSTSYRHPNVVQNSANRNNVVLYNIDTAKSLSVDVRFHAYGVSTWTSYSVYVSGGSWLGYVVRTDNGTNDGLLELPYKFDMLYWPN